MYIIHNIPSIYIIRTFWTQYTHYVHNIHDIHIVYTTYTQYTHYIHNIHIIYTLYTQYIDNVRIIDIIYTTYTHCTHYILQGVISSLSHEILKVFSFKLTYTLLHFISHSAVNALHFQPSVLNGKTTNARRFLEMAIGQGVK